MQQMMTFAPLQPKSRPPDFGFSFAAVQHEPVLFEEFIAGEDSLLIHRVAKRSSNRSRRPRTPPKIATRPAAFIIVP
jgi:hypothetical protein